MNDILPQIEKKSNFYLFKRVSLRDKYNFFDYLSIMLDGGVALPQALESVQVKIKNPYFKEQIQELLLFINSGDSFNKAMKKLPTIFNASEYSLIEAWEKSGTLVESLGTLANELKKLYELKLTVQSALTYPLIIIIFLVVAVIVVMTYVIPALIPIIDDAGVEKPFATIALMATSNFFVNHFFEIILFLLALVFLVLVYRATDMGRQFFDRLTLQVPLVGEVYKNYLLASSISTFWILMNSGIPIIKSLTLVWRSTNNSVYEWIYNDVSIQVWAGKQLVEGFEIADGQYEYFPPDFLQLLSVGEKTASLDVVCKKLNDQYSREVNYALWNLTKWIEPIAIFIAWIFVLWFAFAIFGSILQLTQTIG